MNWIGWINRFKWDDYNIDPEVESCFFYKTKCVTEVLEVKCKVFAVVL